MRKIFSLLFLVLVSCNQLKDDVATEKKSSGPSNGKLLIGGGGMTEDLWKAFNEFGGGDTARLVVIPTSWDENSINHDPTFSIIRKQFLKRGFQTVNIIHTRDSRVANTEEFVAPIKNATAVWLSGGRQWRSADVYLNTKVHQELIYLLERGGIIGGHSAGASIQGSFMVRGRRDEFGSYYISGGQEKGFSFLENSAIDQHHLIRNRHFEMFEVLKENPELLGLGIGENTAILVQGNSFEVIGDKFVTVYDGTIWSPYFDDIHTLTEGEEKFYFLSNGNKYDLLNRRVIVNKYLPYERLTPKELSDYVGHYQRGTRNYWYEIQSEQNTLRLIKTDRYIVHDPITIFPYERDLFFEKESNWWFEFSRDSTGQVTSVTRKLDILINDRIETLIKKRL